MAIVSNIPKIQQRILPHRIPINPIVLMGGTTAFILLFDNATLWSKGFEVFSGYLGQLYILMVAMFFLYIALFAVFGSRRTLQSFLAFMLILASITSYYMDTLGVIIDRDMVQNVMATTLTESKHLLTFGFILQVVVWGILPAIAVFYFKLPKRSFLRSILVNSALFIVCIALTVGLLFTNFKTYSSVARERKDFLGSQQPGAALVGTVRYFKRVAETQDIIVKPIGTDAKKGDKLAAAKKPVFSILVIGETARNQNIGLDGYSRQTTPELAKRSVVNYSDVNSCGTATAVSMPCMFSKFDRGSYSYKKGMSNENLVDVLRYAGMDVEWWDNNTGDKKLAARIKSRKFTNMENEEFCPTGECMDGIFQQYLEEKIKNIKQDTVLVLHLIGNHGPTYYLRYPDAFEVYKPACRTAEFKKCTPAEIVNAYDNAIVYTDYILASTIDLLAKNDNLLTSMMYVSDHGESLGENGLYLHGSPYFLAPKTQTKVPMVLWMSPNYKEQFGIDQDCLEANADKTISHANFFHSVLGMLDIKTSERKDDLDIFAKCKN